MQGLAVTGGGGGHVPHLGTEDGMSIPRGGAGIRALEVRPGVVAVFAPEIPAAPLVPVPLENRQARGDPRKERAQLRQIFRECAPGVGRTSGEDPELIAQPSSEWCTGEQNVPNGRNSGEKGQRSTSGPPVEEQAPGSGFPLGCTLTMTQRDMVRIL